MASTKPFHLAIVGGGISGLTLAIGLLQHDIPFTIYEAAPHFGEIGAGVAFGPNAARAMELISTKLNDAFNKCKTTNVWNAKRYNFFTCRVGDSRKADAEGFVRPGKKVGDALFDVPFTTQSNTGGVYRAHFLDELVKEIPPEMARFGKKLVDISNAQDGSEDVILHFEDGTTVQHNAVIGCDGIKSKAREWLLGKDDPAARAVFSGKYAYRGLIPMDQAIEMLGEEVAQNSQMFFGYQGHLLTFPIEKGKTMNVVAFNSRQTWDKENWVVKTSKQEMDADYAAWGPTVQKIIGAMQKPDIWALFMHPPCSTFYKGRVCLLGDAAHATTPHHGAGAGMCLEDALVLSSLIKEAKDVRDLEKVFAVYDEVRRPRSQRNVKESKDAGMLYDFELEGDDLDKIEKNFLSRMGWIWDIDLDDHLTRAKEMYHGRSTKL